MKLVAAMSLLSSLWALPMGKSALATACCLAALLGSCGVLILPGRRS
jgi:hypothetical protein